MGKWYCVSLNTKYVNLITWENMLMYKVGREESFKIYSYCFEVQHFDNSLLLIAAMKIYSYEENKNQTETSRREEIIPCWKTT